MSVTKSDTAGLDAYMARVLALDGHGVKVGVQSDAGSHDGTSLLDIAIYNEFGTDTIPARPFIRDFANKNGKVLGIAMDRMADAVTAGKKSVGDALGTLGEFAQQHQQAHVRKSKSWAVPNKPATIRAKSSSKSQGLSSTPVSMISGGSGRLVFGDSSIPLIDHGVLVNAIRWEKV